MKKSIIHNLNPFNNETNMPAVLYIIKKYLAFILIYAVSALVGEGIIIGSLFALGYDPLQGIMPEGQLSELLPYFGFIVFSTFTVVYCRCVEKKNMKHVGFNGKPIEYLVGILVAFVLLTIILSICCMSNAMDFCGINTNVNIKNILLWILAFGIQGATEEIMCRGFLLNTLKKKVSIQIAVLISSTAFVIPHLSSLFEMEFGYAFVGIINLYLISFIFSNIVLWRSNIWIVCGLHSAWNFILYVIMGLSLSGSESTSNGVVSFLIKDASILNGGKYGIEASVITTIVLGIVLFVTIKGLKGRSVKNGIS